MRGGGAVSIPVVVPQATLNALAAMRLTQVSSDDPLPPDGGGGDPLLLDTYTGAAAAYSLKRRRSAYSGASLRVRRSSDSAEQDIGFSGNDLDTTSLLSFVGSGDGFVTTWYDQSGNGRHATQTTAVSQPQIVSSGVVEDGVLFMGTGVISLALTGATALASLPMTVAARTMVVGSRSNFDVMYMFTQSSSWNTGYGLYLGSTPPSLESFSSVFNSSTSFSASDLEWFNFAQTFSGSDFVTYKNGSSVGTGTVGSNYQTNAAISVLGLGHMSGGNAGHCRFSDFVIFNADYAATISALHSSL